MRRTKAILAVSGILLIYGYLARWLSLYFFWDSKAIGGELLLVALVSLLFDNMITRKNQNRTTTWNKVGIVLLSARLVIVLISSIYIRFTDAYSVAIGRIENDGKLREEIGVINSWGLRTGWFITTVKDGTGESGFALFKLTAEGEKEYRDLTVQVVKDPENPDWHVTEVY